MGASTWCWNGDASGERWRTERWDSLRVQFPNWSLQIPGYTYTGADLDGFAHCSQILRIIEAYAVSTRAPVREHTEVVSLDEDGHGTGFVVSSASGSLHARCVVVATGSFQRRALIPQPSQHISPSVLQTDLTRYRCPGGLPAGAVLIVGSGASGCQIADELLHAGRSVYLSVSRHRRAPRRLRGGDVYWWLDKMGRFAQPIDSFPGRRWRPSTVVTGVNGGYDVNVRQLAVGGVRVVGRVVGASGDRLAIEANANQILDEADKAYARLPVSGRQFALTRVQQELAEEQPAEPARLPAAINEVDSLNRRENVNPITSTSS